MISPQRKELAAKLMQRFDGHIDESRIERFAMADVTEQEDGALTQMIEMVLDGLLSMVFDSETDDPILELTDKGKMEARNIERGQ